MAESSSFFDKPAGKIVAGVVLVVGVGLIVWTIMNAAGGGAAAAANQRMFVDAATGKAYWVDLDHVSDIPAQVPGGGKTGYPAELCYWTADGKTKDEPTGVLLNETVGKSGPTFCPDCKRLVVGHNPPPAEGVPPPPTEAEYKANPRRGSSGGDDRN